MFTDEAAHLFGVCGAAVFVDVRSVRRCGDGNDFDSEFLEDQRGDVVGGSVRAVENGFGSLETAVLNGAFREFDISSSRVVDAVGFADARGGDFGRFAADDFFDFVFDFIGKLEAVGVEDLDSVVVGGVVGSGDHDSAVRAHGADEVGDGGGRERSDFQNIHAHAEHAARQRGFEHVSGNAGVLADHRFCNAVFICMDLCDSFSHFERNFRSDRIFVRFAANSVGSK